MKKIFLLAIICSLMIKESNAQYVNIPDTNFYNFLIKKGIDKNNDKKIDTSEVNKIDTLIIKSNTDEVKVKKLNGIEYFINLKYLNCSYNKILNIDVTKNTKLKTLICSYQKDYYSQLTEIDISKNKDLEYLDCSANQINTIDLSQNKKLKKLICHSNQFDNINLTNNQDLEYLDCEFNKIKTLILDNVKLTKLYAQGNIISKIDISKCINLVIARLFTNEISEIDFSKNTKLTYLALCVNKIKNLDISTLIELDSLYFNLNSDSVIFICNNKKLKYINFKMLGDLKKVHVWTLPFPPAGLKIDINYYDTLDYILCEKDYSIEEKNKNDFSFYPNPASTELKINVGAYHDTPLSYKIYGIIGKVVGTQNFVSNDNIIDISKLNKGIYIIELTTKEEIYRSKFVKE